MILVSLTGEKYLDTFSLTGEKYPDTFSLTEDKNRLSALVDTIRKTISEERDPKVLIKEFKNIQIPSRKDSFIIEPRVLIDNLSSPNSDFKSANNWGASITRKPLLMAFRL